MFSAVGRVITGGLVVSVSLALLVIAEEEEDDGEVDVITMDAFSTNPVMEA
jgi:hypothetical protein